MRAERELPWELAEPGLGTVVADARRALRRGWARPIWVLGLSVLMTAATVGWTARRDRLYSTTVVLRVTEADLEAGSAPRTVKNLRDYVSESVFTGHALRGVMNAWDLYPAQRRLDEQLALDAMREDISVEVWRNYFLEDRYETEPGRTARVSISYRSAQPERAYHVAHELARLVTETEAERRAAQATARRDEVAAALARAREEIVSRRAEIVGLELERDRGRGEERARRDLELRDLAGSLEELDRRAREAADALASFEVRLGMERRAIGLVFEVADPGRVARAGPSTPAYLAMVGAVLFLVALPLAALWIGARDRRLYELGDLERLGLPALGAIPSFAGEQAGALATRLPEGPEGAGAVVQHRV